MTDNKYDGMSDEEFLNAIDGEQDAKVAKKAPAKRAAKKTTAKKAVAKKETNPIDDLLKAVEVARAAGVTVHGTAVVLNDDVTTERNL